MLYSFSIKRDKFTHFLSLFYTVNVILFFFFLSPSPFFLFPFRISAVIFICHLFSFFTNLFLPNHIVLKQQDAILLTCVTDGLLYCLVLILYGTNIIDAFVSAKVRVAPLPF